LFSEKLVIELDGDQHGDYEQIEKDQKRDKYLENLAKSTTPAGDKVL
jgi:very-short-patch-repair endonuclease